MLALSEVEKRHDSSLLVLGRVTLEDLIDDFFVLGAELERDGWVVVGFVAVHMECIAELGRNRRE
jgi:hypothetical protein